jgi:hypothetical protein
MICCVIVLRLLAWVYARCGRADGAGGAVTGAPRRSRRLVLPLLAGAEIALAVVLLQLLRPAHRGGYPRHDSPHLQAAHSATAWVVITAALSAAAVGAAVWVAARRGAAVLGAGLLLAAGTAALSQSAAISSSHLLAMVLLESLTIVTPLCLIGIGWNRGLADDVWVVGRAAISISAALGIIAIIIAAHTDSTGRTSWLGAHWWSASAALALSALFWASVLRFRLPQPLRLIIIGMVLEAGALLALAMLVGGAPMNSPAALGLSAQADQRLAALSMMVVDTCLVACWSRAGQADFPSRISAKATT